MASSSLSCGKLASWTIFAVLLQILGLALFVIGFFPVKPTLPGFSGPESYRVPTCDSIRDVEERKLSPEQLSHLYQELSMVPPSYDRMVLMVIDGLPAEFLLGRGDRSPDKAISEAMPYTQSLLSQKKARAYHAKAAPPTVTMPRLKAMVSGAIGGFLDVAFNFNTQAFLDDNLLDQLNKIGWRLVMHGDNTWIKLFPSLFNRRDGVGSFYVKDTIEVDFNVSRHLEVELTANDWDLLILHYLGLDHVGHIGGRQSFLMVPKLKEMDEVIKTIHEQTILHQLDSERRTLLVVVSDHGMTDAGNHGGSSYEETDSLALFVGTGIKSSDHFLRGSDDAFQVDIAPTLALLFGVPIPKNNMGVVLMSLLNKLTDEQRLRALELNAWQLLRLLQNHSPGLFCGNLSLCHGEHGIGTNDGTTIKLCHLLFKARDAHNLWLLHQVSDSASNYNDDYEHAILSYNHFLRNASEWLSHRATDRPVYMLAPGVVMIFISCILLLKLVFYLLKEVQTVCLPKQTVSKQSLSMDKAFVLVGVLMHVLSLGSSSMVEEEQYTWNFLTSTLYMIFLITKTTEMVIKSQVLSTSERVQICCVFFILVCGRIIRGWYQGGVNWVHLPDISKILTEAGVFTVKALQVLSLLFFMVISLLTFRRVKSRTCIFHLVRLSHLVCGLLVLLHIMVSQSHTTMSLDHSSTLVAQIFYVITGSTVLMALLATPWTSPIHSEESCINLDSHSEDIISSDGFLLGIQESSYLIGATYTVFWCLLQLLIQQPINSVPVLLIFLQIVTSVIFFSNNRSIGRLWVEVAAIYFLGMEGHFGLGNSNTLATIDVAGAFIGISSHSTVLSGILMFSITYAAPLIAFLSMIMYISRKDLQHFLAEVPEWSCILKLTIAAPCLVLLVLNSITLFGFTIILWLMSSHLFVWSVFSPKYLYICAATLSIYVSVSIVAVSIAYIYSVVSFRLRRGMRKVSDS